MTFIAPNRTKARAMAAQSDTAGFALAAAYVTGLVLALEFALSRLVS
ncbi:hypothetical protein ACFQY5_19615 [Paeniroseomonas aquatica]|uniref:Uncharacterized protein n=1 Tax=Paeniroseomonas aquatica TaxID=373043 RepID=A0ABT8AAU8_9PROT|nr:hypothetical protein [Paeniroseomonas aquatica]MDN3566793.1 hypothetical protein [Paeniroseomonas aquatica]